MQPVIRPRSPFEISNLKFEIGEPLVRLSLADLQRRARQRTPGYYEDFLAAGRPDPDGQHIYITESAMRELWRKHAAPGLELAAGKDCCGG